MSLYRGPSIIGESADNNVALVLSAISSATNAANAAAAASTSEVNAQSSEEAAAASALQLALYEGLLGTDSATAEASRLAAEAAAVVATDKAAQTGEDRNAARDSAANALVSENVAGDKAAEASGHANAAYGQAVLAANAAATTQTLRDSLIATQGAIGYLPPVAYAAGLAITLPAQTVSYSGQAYAPLLSALPFTTSGVFEAAKFRLIQGVAAVDLAAAGGAGTVGYDDGTTQDVLDASKPVSNYAALRAYAGRATSIRITQVGVAGYFWRAAASVLTADNGGTVIVDASGRRWLRLDVGATQVKWFGAMGDGVTNDTAAMQAAVAFAGTVATTLSRGATVEFSSGEYLFDSDLVIAGNGVKIKGTGVTSTILRFTATTGAAVRADATLRTACAVECLTVRLDVAGSKGIDFTSFSYSDFYDLSFDMRAATQVGVYAKGNGLGTGPYYNTFDKITIVGQTAVAGQVGVQLAPGTTGGFLGDGPNANMFSNFRRVTGVDIGFDIQSGNGNMGHNISLESIANYGFAFNNRSPAYTGTATSGTAGSFTDSAAPFVVAGLGGGAFKIVAGTGAGESSAIRVATTSTISMDYYTRTGVALDNTSQYEVYKSKAIGNKFGNVRMEGAATSAVARFYPGALNNTITQMYATSISTTQWVKDVSESSNFCHTQSSGQVITLPFWKEGGLTAASTLGLNPNTVVALGGGTRLLTRGGNIAGLSVSCDSLTGVVGTATIRVYKANAVIPELDITLNASTVYGNHSHALSLVTSSELRIEPQHDIDVRIVTDVAWTGTTKQISVLLWVQV